MISYWTDNTIYAKFVVAPETPQSLLVAYKKHVSRGTVPPASQVPYTLTGVEKYRHSSVQDEFKPNQKPIYPSWQSGAGLRSEIKKVALSHGWHKEIKKEYPDGYEGMSTQEYIESFRELNSNHGVSI